jgi:hypothetical protein
MGKMVPAWSWRRTCPYAVEKESNAKIQAWRSTADADNYDDTRKPCLIRIIQV